MTVMMNRKSNRPEDGVAVIDVATYEDIQKGLKMARGEKVEKNLPPIRRAMLEQFGYVNKKFKEMVVVD